MRSALHRRSTQERAANGGVAARRAVLRWGWRLFRREWRQQLLVLLLLTITVAAAIFSVTAAYNIIPSSDAQFGTADHRLDIDGADPPTLDTEVSAVRAWFGTAEVIGHQPVPVPGSVETLELRTQDPHGPYGAPMLRLKEGRATRPPPARPRSPTRWRQPSRSASAAPSPSTGRREPSSALSRTRAT